jgi:hypothetical protein
MSKITAVVLTAAICLPLGALLRRDASADGRRLNAHPPIDIVGHTHLSRAQSALHIALDELDASKRAAEPIWNDKTGRAATTAHAIEVATSSLDETAEWVREGMARNDAGDETLENPFGSHRVLVRVFW